MEPISPELVLVDPELARRVRMSQEVETLHRLWRTTCRAEEDPPPSHKAGESPESAQAPQTTGGVIDARSPASPQGRLTPWLGGMLIGLLVSFVSLPLLAHPLRPALVAAAPVVEQSKRKAPSTTPTSAPTAPRAPSTTPTSAPASPSRKAITQDARIAAERTVLRLLPQLPRRRIPAELVDPETGLPRTNVHVDCSGRRVDTFVCAVMPAGAKPQRALHVLYRAGAGDSGALRMLEHRSG